MTIFISHSSKDSKVAQTICTALEHRGFRCWVASRDVGPGQNFQRAIVQAIRAAKVMVLVFTENANASPEILKELALASQSRVFVIPTRVEDVLPSDELTYELSTRQWIDLFNDWEEAIQRLVQQISEIEPPQAGSAIPPPPQPSAPPAPGPDASFLERLLAGFHAARQLVPAVNFAIGVSAVAAITCVVLAFSDHVRAAAILLTGMVTAAFLTIALAPLVFSRSPTLKATSKAGLWGVSVIFITFLALAATAIGFRWPAPAAALLGIEDGITCGRPSEKAVAYSCGPVDEPYDVINILLDDQDRGLNVRAEPTLKSLARGIIPPNGTNVAVTGDCKDGWCPVRCDGLGVRGWSQGRYLSPRAKTLNVVVGNRPSDPGGLRMQSGPHNSCRSVGILPYQSRDVILHNCQSSPLDASNWCRVTHAGRSGWIPQGFLERQN